MNRPKIKRGCLSSLLLLLTLAAGCCCGCLPNLPLFPLPEPLVPVNPSGTKVAVILHDSREQTPEFAALKADLQTTSPASDYIASKGHRMLVLPIDSTDNDNKPLVTVERLKALINGKALPVLFVGPKDADGKIGTPQVVESLPNTAVANDVVTLIKKAGG
jgi:hypothetical protein